MGKNKYFRTSTSFINESNNGKLLWKSLTYSIILEEQMRQNEDENFKNLLKRFRDVTSTKESIQKDYDILNTRINNNNNTIYENEWEYK